MSKFRLYNTLTKKVDDFTPITDDTVKFYSCGPTVYDYPHIGNWYTFIRYDLLLRSLKASGYDVNWVMNITDVGHLVSDEDEGEDKLEKGAKREGSTAWQVAQKYTDYFMGGLERVNITAPNKLPKATDHIQEQIDLIKHLEAKDHTYVIDDGVYFDTSTFPDYGKMAGLNLSEQKEGARVSVNKQKKNPSDFALWKFSPTPPAGGPKRDMEWGSPWGKGFPGWHLECSAMAIKYLGETLDVHAGGIDHIPVHHTNEIAQSESATGKPFSNFWFHANFCLVDGKKIAKSAGGFITLEDIEKKGYDLMAFRLLVLQSHYRTEAHFSWENLEAAQNRLKKWQSIADLRWQLPNNDEPDVKVELGLLKQLSNDLDTPSVLAIIDAQFELIDQNFYKSKTKTLHKLLLEIKNLLGIDLFKDDITDEQKQLLADRQQARDNKDFDESDRIRDQLLKQKLAVRDSDSGQIWSRT